MTKTDLFALMNGASLMAHMVKNENTAPKTSCTIIIIIATRICVFHIHILISATIP